MSTCPHGVRLPHECRECEEAIPDDAVREFAKRIEAERERDAAQSRADTLARTLRWLSEQMVFREEFQKRIDAALSDGDGGSASGGLMDAGDRSGMKP